MVKKTWSDLTPAQQRSVYVVGAAQIAMTTAALRDLALRPANRVAGPRLGWAIVCFVQPVGPPAYFVFGRKRV